MQAHSEAIFIAQVVALVASGRLVGELMHRIGQPAIMGQLVAGMLLGPSVFGALAPDWQHALFPPGPEQKAMLTAISQLGVLLILLMTGMETDLGLVRHSRRAAFSVSLAGIAIPFLCGVWLGERLPDSLLPDPSKRFVSSLFLGIALSISSVKIVALLVRDLGFLRRTVGQVIVASAIIDDTVGWIIMSIVFGIALHGGVDLPSLARSVLGTLTFLALCFTLGRRMVARLIRFANDRFTSELPVIAMILIITGAMALLTDAIGVHTVLGAFVAGILIGQSPILTTHIQEQLRGLIVALFMPVFFGMAGLSADLRVLAQPQYLYLTLGLIAVASVGKFAGAMLGGRFGGLSMRESLAIGCGMNARGSTEIIIATFGLSMGVLSQNLFTAIVTMAVITTLAMPPMLRWAFARLPPDERERMRLEREQAEASSAMAGIERLLVTVDSSRSGELASHLAGLLAGTRGMPVTALHLAEGPGAERGHHPEAQRTGQVLSEAATRGSEAGAADAAAASGDAATPAREVDVDLQVTPPAKEDASIAAAARKGFGLLFIGREPTTSGDDFHEQITRSVSSFTGAFAIVSARGTRAGQAFNAPLHILVPVIGTAASRLGAELATAFAEGSHGEVTALYITAPLKREGGAFSWRRQPWRGSAQDEAGEAILRDVEERGRHRGVRVRSLLRRSGHTAEAIFEELQRGHYDVLVSGVSPRPGRQLFLGEVAADLLARSPASLVLVSDEAAAAGDVDSARGDSRG